MAAVRLREGLTMLWRAPDAVQVGTDPRCAVVVEGLSAADHRWLLCATAAPGDGPPPAAAGAAVPAERRDALLRLLERAGVLAEAPPAGRTRRAESADLTPDAAALTRLGLPGRRLVASRAHRSVCVAGLDAVGAEVALALAQAGVGTLLLADDGPVTPADLGIYDLGDLGAAREGRLRAAVRRVRPAVRVPDAGRSRRRADPPGSWPDVWPGAAWHRAGSAPPDLVVLVRPWTVPLPEVGRLQAADVPHLVVTTGEIDVEVGPLVVPGRTACARCVGLARTDADPHWPAVATQLALCAPPGTDRTTALRAGGLAAQAALAFLDARPLELAGASASVGAGGLLPRMQQWAPHPECGCGANGG